MISRPYAGESDYELMRALVIDIYARTNPPVYCTLGELDWWRFSDTDTAAATQAQLWFDPDGPLIGFVWPDRRQVDLVVHPDYASIEPEMLAWAEDHRLAASHPEEASVTLTAWAFSNDFPRQSILKARRYEATGYFLSYRARSLRLPIAPPVLPPGYRLSYQTDDTIAARVATHRDAFGSTKMTVASYRAVRRAPTYREGLDLVVCDPDGLIAAFALAWFDEANRIGTFEPVGTHAKHRRHGLARTLMHEGMRQLRALGAQTACVVSGGDEEAANRLYDDVGLVTIARNSAWLKRLLRTRQT